MKTEEENINQLFKNISAETELNLHYRLAIARQLCEYLDESPTLKEKLRKELNLKEDQLNQYLWGTKDIKISEIAQLEAIIRKPLLLTPFLITHYQHENPDNPIFNLNTYNEDLYDFLEITKDSPDLEPKPIIKESTTLRTENNEEYIPINFSEIANGELILQLKKPIYNYS